MFARIVTTRSYGAQYAAGAHKRLGTIDKLLLVLAVPGSTPTLQRELDFLGAGLGKSREGYADISGLTIPACVAFLDEISEAESDGIVGLFARGRKADVEGWRWLHAHLWRREGVMEGSKIEELEGFEELKVQMLESLPAELRLKGLAPEQRLAGLAPEQRLAGLSEEELREMLDGVLRKLEA